MTSTKPARRNPFEVSNVKVVLTQEQQDRCEEIIQKIIEDLQPEYEKFPQLRKTGSDSKP